jgi:intracellular septation protein
MSEEAKGSDAAAQPHGTKLMIELGPLLAFFVAWILGGVFWATGVLMVASVVAAFASRTLLGHISPVVIATVVLVLFFGGLTFWFDDPAFIMVKPTIINLLFAGVLLAGLLMKRQFLKLLLGEAFNLTDEGWRKLTVRWIFFFVALAGLNEIIRNYFSQAVWFNFKAYGILALTMIFAMSQIGLIKRYEPKAEA